LLSGTRFQERIMGFKMNKMQAAFTSNNSSMNKLPVEQRVQILSMLCEGSSMRSVSRVCGVSITR